MKKIIRVSSVPVIALTMAALTACEPNASDGALNVKATNTECSVSSDTAESGSRQFTIKNEGDIVTEFYLLGEDKLRIVAEKENIAPGAEATLSVSLQPGTYFTACKLGYVEQMLVKLSSQSPASLLRSPVRTRSSLTRPSKTTLRS